MEESKRTSPVNGEEITNLRKTRGWTQATLAAKAGLSESTVQRLESDPEYRMHVRSIQALADVLEVPAIQILRSEAPDGSSSTLPQGYSWKRIMDGAAEVAREAFGASDFCADAILAFGGASSIFAGLVLVALQDPRRFMRIPVYTAILADKETEPPCPEQFEVVGTRCFNLFVPKALFESGHRDILTVENTIISGGAMDELRVLLEQRFENEEGAKHVKFACCICHNSLGFGNRMAPEILGIPELETREKVPMPWNINSYRYEEAFCPEFRIANLSENSNESSGSTG